MAYFSKVLPSPQSTGEIMVHRKEAPGEAILIVDSGGKQIRKIPREFVFDHDYSWSPDGSCAIFTRIEKTAVNKVVKRQILSGREEAVLLSLPPLMPCYSVLSPDGTRFASCLWCPRSSEPEEITTHQVICAAVGSEFTPYDLTGLEVGDPLPTLMKVVAEVKILPGLNPGLLQWSAHRGCLGFHTASAPDPGVEGQDPMLKALDKPALYVYDCESERLTKLDIKGDVVYAAAISPDGQTFAYSAIEGIWLWRVKEGRVDHLLNPFARETRERVVWLPASSARDFWGPVSSLQWSPDGRRLYFHTWYKVFVASVVSHEVAELLSDNRFVIHAMACTFR